MSDSECAWVAGVLSCFGVLTHTHHVMPVRRLQIKSLKHAGMVRKLAKLTGVPIKVKKTGTEINFYGEELDLLLAMVFRDMTPERVEEFSLMAGVVDKIRLDYQDKKKYEAERAAAPHSTPDSIRHRAEALYHNQDEAVQVVEGFVQAEMATQYDLEQARIAREKAEAQMTQGHVKKHRR